MKREWTKWVIWKKKNDCLRVGCMISILVNFKSRTMRWMQARHVYGKRQMCLCEVVLCDIHLNTNFSVAYTSKLTSRFVCLRCKQIQQKTMTSVLNRCSRRWNVWKRSIWIVLATKLKHFYIFLTTD